MNQAQIHEVREAVRVAFPLTPGNRRAPFRFLRTWLRAGEPIEFACDRLRSSTAVTLRRRARGEPS